MLAVEEVGEEAGEDITGELGELMVVGVVVVVEEAEAVAEVAREVEVAPAETAESGALLV